MRRMRMTMRMLRMLRMLRRMRMRMRMVMRKMKWRRMMLRKMRWKMMKLRMMMWRGGKWWCSEWWCWGGGPIPRPRTTLCASLPSRNAFQHFHFTRATFYGNWQEKCHAPKPRRPDFVRACAVETHCHRFPKSHSRRKCTGKMTGPRVSALIKHRPLLLP